MSPLVRLASKRYADRSKSPENDSARPELWAALGRVLDLSYRGGPRDRQPLVEIFLMLSCHRRTLPLFLLWAFVLLQFILWVMSL